MLFVTVRLGQGYPKLHSLALTVRNHLLLRNDSDTARPVHSNAAIPTTCQAVIQASKSWVVYKSMLPLMLSQDDASDSSCRYHTHYSLYTASFLLCPSFTI